MAPSTAYQSCAHTDPSAKSEEFQTNSPRQEERKNQLFLVTEDVIIRERLSTAMVGSMGMSAKKGPV
jgi:hypothetical protein